MALSKIENLLDLGQEIIVKLDTNRLTASGENYGSQMFALKIQTPTKTLEVVAKVPPPTEFIKKMFNVPVTFKNEIFFYQKIVPELEKFLKEKNYENYLDCFPKFIGARLSLNPQQTEVDDNAVLILENLKIQGYEMLERTVGFDYETSRLIIRSLAKYHAAPIALKLQKPELFQTKIRSLFQPYRVFEFDDDTFNLIVKKFRKYISEIDSCKAYAQRVADFMKATPQIVRNGEYLIREPFATIIHTDGWVNNFMIKFEDGKAESCKIVDFQLIEYGSPARDLLFLIFSSIQTEIVEKHYDTLVKFYHESLVEDLRKFGCDTQDFSWEAFSKEIDFSMEVYELFHIVVMLQPIYATKDGIKELDEYKDEDLFKYNPMSPQMKEKLEVLIHQFVKRKWL